MKLLFIGLVLAGAAFAQEDSYLTRGQLEVRGLVGVFGASRLSPRPAYGGELAYGLKNWVAVTGGYVYNSLVAVNSNACTNGVCSTATGKAGIKETTAGVRFTTRGRVALYAAASGGMAILSSKVSGFAGPFSVSDSKASKHMAAAGGGGADFSLSRSWGFAADVRMVKPIGLTPYLRMAGGVYFRFQ